MSDFTRAQERSAELLLLAVVLIWASNYPIAKYGIAGLNPFVFNAIRYVSASVAVGVLFRISGLWKPIPRSDYGRIARLGIIASIIYQLAFIYGLSLTTAGNSAILLSTAPLWTVFFNSRIHHEPIPRATWVGMVVSFSGVILIVTGSEKQVGMGNLSVAGDLLTLGAACLWGLNTNLQKSLLATYSAFQLTLIMVLIGAAGLTLICLPTISSVEWTSIHPAHFLAAALSGALSIGTASLFWSMGVKRLGPRRTANFNNLVPVLAFAISYFSLGEQIQASQVSGAIVTIVGVWIARA